MGRHDQPELDATMYGDGGQSGYDAATRHPVQQLLLAVQRRELRDGDPTAWVIVSGPLFDPNRKPEGGPRSTAGDRRPGRVGHAVPRRPARLAHADNGGNKAALEANCPEFTTFGGQPGCGDLAPLGDPSGIGSARPGHLGPAI